MLRSLLITSIVLLAAATAGADDATPQPDTQPTTQPTTKPDIDPIADQILHQSCDYLAQSKALSVHAEIWKDDVLPSGHKIQVTREVDLDFARPDRFHIDARAHRKGRSIWDDGKKLTVLDRENNLYAVVDAPATVDQALDALAENYGITVPLEDLILSDPYGSAIRNVNAGGYFGDEMVLGVPCKHIGFSTDRIDWQLWVADSNQPLPAKLVITYKTEDQSPQFIAIFSRWNVSDRSSDLPFTFIPPRGSSEIPMHSIKQAQDNKGGQP